MDSAQRPSSPDGNASLSSVLAEIAETASETLELRQVFDRIATSVRRVIPFDHMGVVRILNEHASEHATTLGACPLSASEHGAQEASAAASGESPTCMQPCPLTNW